MVADRSGWIIGLGVDIGLTKDAQAGSVGESDAGCREMRRKSGKILQFLVEICGIFEAATAFDTRKT